MSSDPPQGTARPLSAATGVGFAVACSVAFSINNLAARLAYEGGASAATGNTARVGVAVLMLAALVALRGARPRLARRERLAALAVGGFYFVTSFGYFGAIQYIPVSVAVLVIYTYPLIVGAIESGLGRERLGPRRIAALFIGFAGLALALDPDLGDLPDPRGLLLAALSALGIALVVMSSSRLLRTADNVTLNFHFMLGSLALFLGNLALDGGPVLPVSGRGWIGMTGMMATFAVGQLFLLAAIGRAGPVVTAAAMNLEPVITIILAVLVLDEHFGPLQIMGAALVLGALALMRRPAAAIAADPATARP